MVEARLQVFRTFFSVKIVLDLIRGKDVATATAILMQTPKAASEPLLALLIHCIHPLQQLRGAKGAFFNASAHLLHSLLICCCGA